MVPHRVCRGSILVSAHADPSSNERSNASSHAACSTISGWGSWYTCAKITDRGGATSSCVRRRRSATMSSASSSTSAKKAADAPRPDNHVLYRTIGSRADHSSTSEPVRYFVGSSAVVWAPIRYVIASMRLGPSPARAASRYRRGTRELASTSLPSIRTPGLPNPPPRGAGGGGERVPRLPRHRNRNGPLIVLDEEDLWTLVARCKYERLVRVALRSGTVTVIHDHRGIPIGITGRGFAVELQAHCVSGCVQVLRCEHERVEVKVPRLTRIPSTECHPAHESKESNGIKNPNHPDDVFAVGGEEVILRSGRARRADLGRFLPKTRRPESKLPLSLQIRARDIDSAREGHVAVKLPQDLLLDARNKRRVFLCCRCRLQQPVGGQELNRWFIALSLWGSHRFRLPFAGCRIGNRRRGWCRVGKRRQHQRHRLLLPHRETDALIHKRSHNEAPLPQLLGDGCGGRAGG